MKTNSEIQTISPKLLDAKIAEKALKKFLDNMSVQSAIMDIDTILYGALEQEGYTGKEALSLLWTVKQLKKLLKKLDKSFDIKAYHAMNGFKTNTL